MIQELQSNVIAKTELIMELRDQTIGDAVKLAKIESATDNLNSSLSNLTKLRGVMAKLRSQLDNKELAETTRTTVESQIVNTNNQLDEVCRKSMDTMDEIITIIKGPGGGTQLTTSFSDYLE